MNHAGMDARGLFHMAHFLMGAASQLSNHGFMERPTSDQFIDPTEWCAGIY